MTFALLTRLRLLICAAGVPLCLGHVILQLRSEVFHFAPRLPQRFGFITQNTFRRAFDATANLLDFIASDFLDGRGLRRKTTAHEFGALVQSLTGARRVRLAERVVKVLGNNRLSQFRLLGDAAHVLHEIGHRAFLLLHLGCEFFPFCGITQSLALGLVRRLKFVRNLLLLF